MTDQPDTLKIVEGEGIFTTPVWTVQKVTKATKTGTGTETLIDVDIPDNQRTIVSLGVSATGQGDNADHGGVWVQKLVVDKEEGQIESVEPFYTRDEFGPNLTGHGLLLGWLFELTAAPGNDDLIQIDGNFIDERPLYPSPFYENRANYGWAERLPNLIERNNYFSLHAGLTFDDYAFLKPVFRDFDYTALNEMTKAAEVSAQRTIQRSQNSGKLRFEVTNPKSFGIENKPLTLPGNDESRKIALCEDGTGERFAFYTNPNESGRIEVVSCSNCQNPEVVTTDNVFDIRNPVEAFCVGGVKHLFYVRASDGNTIHAEDSGGSWSTEVVDSANLLNPRLGVAVDSGGVFHVLIAEVGGTLRHFSGTTGSFSQVTSPLSSGIRTFSVAIDDNDNLGLARIDVSSSNIEFQKYIGSWSSPESVDTNGNVGDGINIVWSGSQWHFSVIPDSDPSELLYWYGTSGNFSGPDTVENQPSEALLTRNELVSNGDGTVSVLWTEDRLQIIRFAYGDSNGFGKQTIDPHNEFQNLGVAPSAVDGRTNSIAMVSSVKTDFLISFGLPREVSLDWKAVSEVKHG